jgi:hypothetical protein
MFQDEHGDLVSRGRASLRAYHDESDPDLALERYAEYDDLSEDVEEHLYDMCVHFAGTLESHMRRRYVREFDRQARRAYGDLIPQLNLFGRSDWA